VLVVGPFQRGGIHSYIEEQIARLEGRVLVRAHNSGAPPMGTGRLRFLRGILLGLVALSRFVVRSPPDLLHVHTSHWYAFYRASMYVTFAKYVWGVPVVLHVHGSGFEDFVNTRFRAVRALQRHVFDSCDQILVLSESWKEIVSVRADSGKIRVIHNAVDPDTFPSDVTGHPAHIVFVSNLIERKGVDELASAVERLARRRGGDFRASIAGDGPLRDRVEELSAQFDCIEYLGYVSEEEKRSLLRDGSIYVLPTYAEGLPIAMLEGMAGGNAVVSTSVAAIPEVIGSDRGILVEPGNVDQLVEALETLVDAPERRTRLAGNNRQAIEESHSWDRVVKELLDVYETNA